MTTRCCASARCGPRCASAAHERDFIAARCSDYARAAVSDDATTHYPWPRGGIIGPNRPIALTVLSGALSGQSFELRRGEQIIGRGPQVDIRIDDTGVSREHAKLIWTPHGVFNLLDLRSTNGTAVNG